MARYSIKVGRNILKKEFHIQAKHGTGLFIRKNEQLVITDVSGGQVVDFFAVNTNDHQEFLSTGVTLDANQSIFLKLQDSIYTNRYKPMFTLVYDDVKKHDILHPSCRKEMYDYFYSNGKNHTNCLDTLNKYLVEMQVPIFHSIRPVNFFMNSSINNTGDIAIKPPLSKAGDKVIIQAKMDTLVSIAACSVEESACNSGHCTSIHVEVVAN